MDGGLEIQTIVIPASTEMGSSDQPVTEDIAREEPREEASIPPALQVVHLPERPESRLGAAKLVLTGHKLLPPDQILLNSYLPPRGPTSVMEEVVVPGPDDIKSILHR